MRGGDAGDLCQLRRGQRRGPQVLPRLRDVAGGAARAGLLDAYAGLRDVGAVRKQAITGLVMATLLHLRDAQVRAAIAESRQLFERMGAGLWLTRLDAAEAGRATAPEASLATPRPAVPADQPVVPANR
jgi:hypothetical protein